MAQMSVGDTISVAGVNISRHRLPLDRNGIYTVEAFSATPYNASLVTTVRTCGSFIYISCSEFTLTATDLTVHVFQDPCILLHGFPDHVSSMHHQLLDLARHGCFTWAIGLRGYDGEVAALQESLLSLSSLVADLAFVLDQLTFPCAFA
jgi:hypothetical protein